MHITYSDDLNLFDRSICFIREHYKNVTNSSVVVQWNEVEDYLLTTYTVTWTSESDPSNVQSAALIEQTSYTITGLTLDTVYTIDVIAANRCGTGPEFTTSVSLSTDTTSTTSSISPTVTTSTNLMTIISTATPNSANTTTTTDITSINAAITTIPFDTIATSPTQLSTTTTSVMMNPSTTTTSTISMTTTVSRDTISSTTKITTLMTATSSSTIITYPITTAVTSIEVLPTHTVNPVDDKGNFSSTCS